MHYIFNFPLISFGQFNTYAVVTMSIRLFSIVSINIIDEIDIVNVEIIDDRAAEISIIVKIL